MGCIAYQFENCGTQALQDFVCRQCHTLPRAGFSEGKRPRGLGVLRRCDHGEKAMLIAVFSLNVLVDFIFALFPLVLLRKLQIPREVRVATYLLLSCGLLAAVCSIGRLVSSKLDAETNAVTRKFGRLGQRVAF